MREELGGQRGFEVRSNPEMEYMYGASGFTVR